MIANIFHPIFTLTITILVCFVRKKQNCLGDLHPRFHQGIALDPLLTAPQIPSFNRFWLCVELKRPYFFCIIPCDDKKKNNIFYRLRNDRALQKSIKNLQKLKTT